MGKAAVQRKAPRVTIATKRSVARPSVVTAAPVMLDPGRGLRREPVRPAAFRIGDFDREFDALTLFYDAFRAPTGTHIVLLGPPLLNLRPLAEEMRAVALPSGASCGFHIRELDRHAQVWVEVPRGTERLALSGPLGTFEVAPRDNLGSRFAGRRVLLTLSKNNRPEWIADWVRYHRDIHGVDAVLFYDNASTRYAPEELAATITAIPGIEDAAVVAWPFKYGPQGLDAKRFWDSDFCQSGVFEHARWCFLAAARSVMNADIDELVVSTTGVSAFAAAERSRFGVIRYRGLWVPGIEGTTRVATDRQPLRHREFQHVLAPRRVRRWLVLSGYEDRCPPKWVVVPRRCPQHAQWSVHSFKNWLPSLPVTSAFGYRHFREINDNWKYDRSARPAFDPVRHVRDDALLANFARVKWDA
jgi:hypothetical protein